MTTPVRKFTARYRPVRDLSVNDIVDMHRLFAGLYQCGDLPTFLRELQTNDGTIMVRARDTEALCGFTTIRTIPLTDGEQEALGVFSGKVVLDPASGGERALNDAFTRRLLYLWLNARGVPLYWLLISSSYTTYSLLANNFANYHPRPDRQIDPRLQRLIRQYTDQLFPGRYDEARGILDLGEGGSRLREEPEPITATMRLQDPVIDYFEQSNPGWRIGHQLPCIGEISLALLQPQLTRERLKIQGKRPSGQRAAIRPAPC